jgi:uncharacterized repeat protein (TIGR03803 family)
MNSQQTPIANRHSQSACTPGAAAVLLVLLLAASAAQNGWAESFSLLYSFSGRSDGEYPFAGVTIGDHGNLYGTTTTANGGNGSGVVYELEHRGSGWVLDVLLTFDSLGIGRPYAGVVFGPEGAIYGTTAGTAYILRPITARCHAVSCPWRADIIRRIGNLGYGSLTLDHAGNLYDTTISGGANRSGSVYELAGSGRNRTFTTLYSFGQGLNDGEEVFGGVIFDAAGNLYGTTTGGGENRLGTVYELTPTADGWSESVLYSFNAGDSGAAPYSTLVVDSSGNLYGTTVFGGAGGSGTVFELSPSGGSWIFSVLYSFANCTTYSGLSIDSAGNLYGVCPHGGANDAGMVYKLSNSGGSWALTDLYDFTGHQDGRGPAGVPALDGNGNLFGTAEFGGSSDSGTVWELSGVAAGDSQARNP